MHFCNNSVVMVVISVEVAVLMVDVVVGGCFDGGDHTRFGHKPL